MREYRGETGGRFTYIEDFIYLQELALSMGAIFTEFGDFALSGCVPDVDSGTISEGYVFLNGKVRHLSETKTKFPCYIVESNSVENVPYQEEQTKIGRINYSCIATDKKPDGEIDEVTGKPKVFLTIEANQSKNPTLKNAFFGKYSILSSSLGRQSVSGGMDFDGSVNVNGKLSANTVDIGVGQDTTMSISLDTDVASIFMVKNNQRKKMMSIYDDGTVRFIGNDNNITFKNGSMSITSIRVGRVRIGDGAIGVNSGSNGDTLKINNDNKGRFANLEIYDGKNILPVISLNGDSDFIDFYIEHRASKITSKNFDNKHTDDGFSQKISIVDKDNVSVFDIHAKKDSVNMGSKVKDIEVIGKDKINVVSKQFSINGVDVNKNFATKTELKDATKNLVVKDGDKQLSDNNFTNEQKDKIESIKDGKIKAGDNGYVTGGDAFDEFSKYLMIENKLNEFSDLDESEKRQICLTIGAAYASAYQPKIKDTGWVQMEDAYGHNLQVKQYGQMVNVRGMLRVDQKVDMVFAKLPNIIDPPKHKVIWQDNEISGNQGNRGIEIGFEANGRQLRLFEQKGYEGTTRPINIMYLI